MTKADILNASRRLFARRGSDGVSIRTLAAELGCAPSVLYYHFENKDQILEAMYRETNHLLGEERAKLPQVSNPTEMLRQRIMFQFDHMEEVVSVLKYYLEYREQFLDLGLGILPAKAYLHMLEVIEMGIEQADFKVIDPPLAARMVTHTVNGFLLEQYPKPLGGLDRLHLVDEITEFVLFSLRA